MCSTRGALGPFSSQGAVMHFIYNAPRKTKPKDVLQFIFLRSPHKPKSKDFLQLILLIFYFEYPLKTWRNPFLATNFLLCTSSSRSYFTSWRSTKLSHRQPLKSPKFCFSSQNLAVQSNFFSKKCDFSSFVVNTQYNMALFSQKALNKKVSSFIFSLGKILSHSLTHFRDMRYFFKISSRRQF